MPLFILIFTWGMRLALSLIAAACVYEVTSTWRKVKGVDRHLQSV
jgi:hypothetical protein